jgi:hypothetical protein
VLPLRRLTDPWGHREPGYRDPDEVSRGRRPWGLVLFVAAFGIYLTMRIVQMASWGFAALF